MALFSSRPITNIPTYFGVLGDVVTVMYLLFILLAIIFAQLVENFLSNENLVAVSVILLFLPPLVVWAERQRLRTHFKALAAFARANNYQFYPSDIAASSDVVFGSVAKMYGARNPKALNAVQAENWLYCDFTYDIYRQPVMAITKPSVSITEL